MIAPRRWLQLILILLLTVLTACGGNTPPKGLAPGREIVKHAIARQLTLTENRLTTQLDNPSETDFEIQNLNIQSLNPLYIADLPTYKINGTYRLKLNLPRQEITQDKNEFQVYLQRQVEGKTWRLLIRETASAPSDEEKQKDEVTAWASYLVT
jgi:hypothetical protein